MAVGLFKWLHSRATHKLLSTACRKGETAAAQCVRPWLHLLNWAHPKKSSTPPSWKKTFEDSRAKGKATDYSMKLCHKCRRPCQETQGDTITNLTAEPVSLHCSHHDLNVSIHDGICLRLSVLEATNYLSVVSTIVCFIDTLFNVSINNIVVTNAALAWGVDSTCRVHGC